MNIFSGLLFLGGYLGDAKLAVSLSKSAEQQELDAKRTLEDGHRPTACCDELPAANC